MRRRHGGAFLNFFAGRATRVSFVAFLWHTLQRLMGVTPCERSCPSPPRPCSPSQRQGARFDGELLDLYVAILIVVPLGAVPEIAVVLSAP